MNSSVFSCRLSAIYDDDVLTESGRAFQARVLGSFPKPAWVLTFTFTFTFGEDSMLSSAEAIIKFGPMRNPEITKRLSESLCGFCKTSKECVVELVEVL